MSDEVTLTALHKARNALDRTRTGYAIRKLVEAFVDAKVSEKCDETRAEVAYLRSEVERLRAARQEP